MAIDFPRDFVWGAATAAYQVEGAVKEDGRGESIWDRFSHTPGKIDGNDTGDIACDHFHRYKEDIAIMKELGLKSYRLSIAWPRIFPDGKGRVNQAGVAFYNRLLDELLHAGIEPLVTIYHWDLPQALQDQGGWANRQTIDYFAEYAAFLFQTFGDRVPQWITHNEPHVVAFYAHADGMHAPGLKDRALAVQVSHHLLLSHAKAVQAFRELNCRGRIGISLDLTPVYPATDSPRDTTAARLADGEKNRWFLDPLFKGHYPADILELYRDQFKAPVFMSGDRELITAWPVDFLGINYYSRAVVKYSPRQAPFQYEQIRPQGPDYTDMEWEIYPRGIYDLLIRIQKDYDGPHIYITENGAAFKEDKEVGGMIVDDDRLEYVKQHLMAVREAIAGGVKLDGYYLWSLMDNFEWSCGYSKKFGIIKVDYRTLARSWKKSAYWYRDVIRNNGWE